MALLIKEEFKSLGDLLLSNIYIRLQYHIDYTGKRILVETKSYSSKESYDSNNPNYELNLERIPKRLSLYYNRETDGIDILSFIHNKLKEKLMEEKIFSEISTDENGSTNTDENGNILEETTVIPGFTDAGIEIIDL